VPTFERKHLTGVDSDVFESLAAWSTSGLPRVTFFVPPLNRKAIATCGGAALGNLDAVIADLADKARRHHTDLIDLSHGLDGHEEVFADYGHLEDGADFCSWTGPLNASSR
jgi:hypothetical protein